MSLDFIYSPKHKRNIEDILYSAHPNHPQRVWMVKWLYKTCNMSARDIQKLIEKESSWEDYNIDKCAKQVSSLCDGEPTGFSEDLSFSNTTPDNNYKKDNTCYDRSCFSRLNKKFFDGALITAYEYSLDKFNLHGKTQWNVFTLPVFRSIEGKNNKMFYIDLDCKDIEYGWTIAKDIFSIDDWNFFKYSGSKGFHLCKFIKDLSKDEMYNMLDDIYQSVKSNLVSFEYEDDKHNTKLINIDPSSINKNRLVRAYCVNLKSGRYSIPVNVDMKLTEIIDISSNIKKIEQYLKS